MIQDVHGIVLVNKPLGLSSNAVLQKVKRIYGAKKAGHTGSLDPLATGMLPICLGDATKFSQYLLDEDKSYQVTGLLGIRTSTGDAAGEIIQQTHNFEVTLAKLQSAIGAFKGEICQTPSMYSALKYQGRPLYDYARKGITVPAKTRLITVHQITLTAFDGLHFSLMVHCSKGTYIRNLVEDIGEKLGVGAHVARLHRTAVGGFTQDRMYDLDAFAQMEPAQLQNCVLAMDRPVQHLPKIHLNPTETLALQQGKILNWSIDNFDAQSLIRVYNVKDDFIGLAIHLESGQIRAKRLRTLTLV